MVEQLGVVHEADHRGEVTLVVRRLHEVETGGLDVVPALVVEQPGQCVARGLARLLDDPQLYADTVTAP